MNTKLSARHHVELRIATILDPAIGAPKLAVVLRANCVMDVDHYRRLGRGKLRVAMFPAVDSGDVQALAACVDHVVDRFA